MEDSQHSQSSSGCLTLRLVTVYLSAGILYPLRAYHVDRLDRLRHLLGIRDFVLVWKCILSHLLYTLRGGEVIYSASSSVLTASFRSRNDVMR